MEDALLHQPTLYVWRMVSLGAEPAALAFDAALRQQIAHDGTDSQVHWQRTAHAVLTWPPSIPEPGPGTPLRLLHGSLQSGWWRCEVELGLYPWSAWQSEVSVRVPRPPISSVGIRRYHESAWGLLADLAHDMHEHLGGARRLRSAAAV